MRKLEYEKFKEHILEYYESPKELLKEIRHYQATIPEASGGTIFIAIDAMCQYGCFDVYYRQVLDTLKDVYGDEYDESKYLTKNGEIRFKNNAAYCWTVYKAKIARTIYEMYKKGEL